MRQYLGGGRRGPWMGDPEEARRPFERIDGSVMTDEEISKVAKGDTTGRDALTVSAHRQPINPEQVWELVARLGTQTAAARELGVSQGAIQSGLKRYMRDHGLNGPLPGKLTREQMSAAAKERAKGQKIVEVRGRAAQRVPVNEPVKSGPSAIRAMPAEPKTSPSAFDLEAEDAFLKGASESAQQPVVAIVRETNRGVSTDTANKAVDALISVLVDIGPDWTDAEAERWLRAFTATVDLVYPTRAAA